MWPSTFLTFLRANTILVCCSPVTPLFLKMHVPVAEQGRIRILSGKSKTGLGIRDCSIASMI